MLGDLGSSLLDQVWLYFRKESGCPYCNDEIDISMNTQCPNRLTIGIDLLPGSFFLSFFKKIW